MVYRAFVGFSIVMFVFAFMYLSAGIVLFSQGGAQSARQPFTMLTGPWIALGILAAWTGSALKRVSERLDMLESRQP